MSEQHGVADPRQGATLQLKEPQLVNIGISSVIGMLHPIARTDPGGASATIVPNGRKVILSNVATKNL